MTLTSHGTSRQGITISHRVRRDIHEAARIHSRRFVTRAITVAEAGERPNNTKTMNTSQFSLANRKQLADLLADRYDGLRSKAKHKLSQKSQELRQSLIKEFAEKKGATKLASQIEVADAKVEELKAELSALGFEFYNGDLSLHDQRNNLLDKTIDARIDKELGTADDIDARFDSAQIAMMTVASLEDAQKLLKVVSEIQ
jgi:hypothetical protein